MQAKIVRKQQECEITKKILEDKMIQDMEKRSQKNSQSGRDDKTSLGTPPPPPPKPKRWTMEEEDEKKKIIR